jgi:hypothetical protein
VPGQAAGTLHILKGKDIEKGMKRLLDPITKKLIPEALEACHITGINPDDLNEKTLEYF